MSVPCDTVVGVCDVIAVRSVHELCFWCVSDASCCSVQRFWASRRLRHMCGNVHRRQETSTICYMSSGGRPYSSSSTIANSPSIMKPSAASMFSAVSVGCQKWAQRRVRMTDDVEIASDFRQTLAAPLQERFRRQVSRTGHRVGSRNDLCAQLCQRVLLDTNIQGWWV